MPKQRSISQSGFDSHEFISQVTRFYLGGVPVGEASAFDMDKGYGGDDYFVTGGYSRVIDAIYQSIQSHPQFKLVTQAKVTDVRDYCGAQGVSLAIQEKEGPLSLVSFHFAVLTIPLPLIKDSFSEETHPSIVFSPPLLMKKALLDKVKNGLMLKLFLYFEKPFWEKGTQFILPLGHYKAIDLENPWFSAVVHPSKKGESSILTVCFFGTEAIALSHATDEAIFERGLAILKPLLRQTPLPKDFHVGRRWLLDEQAKGGWSVFGSDMTRDDFKQLGQPVGALFFAGDMKGGNTVHQAMTSGQKAAEEVHQARLRIKRENPKDHSFFRKGKAKESERGLPSHSL